MLTSPFGDNLRWKCGSKRHGWSEENRQKWLGLLSSEHMIRGTYEHGNTRGVVYVGTPLNVQGTWAYRYTSPYWLSSIATKFNRTKEHTP